MKGSIASGEVLSHFPPALAIFENQKLEAGFRGKPDPNSCLLKRTARVRFQNPLFLKALHATLFPRLHRRGLIEAP